MKNTRVFSSLLLVSCLVALTVADESNSSEEDFQYECSNEFVQYHLDNAPAEYGLSAGEYAEDKEAYVGWTTTGDFAFLNTRIQLSPPGAVFYTSSGPSLLLNVSSRIYYLRKNPNHRYRWVDSQNGEVPPHAVKVGGDLYGFFNMVGRVKDSNGFVSLGEVTEIIGAIYYSDTTFTNLYKRNGYQVLTCTSSVPNEPPIPSPLLPFMNVPNVDPPSGCVNTWAPYNNDATPNVNGVSAGTSPSNNTAFVGKAKVLGMIVPGRIQTNSPKGFYTTNAGQTMTVTSGALYLVNNPNYTYRWVAFDPFNIPTNLVLARNDMGNFFLLIGRVRVGGEMQIGRFLPPELSVPDGNGGEVNVTSFELLVCDPVPAV